MTTSKLRFTLQLANGSVINQSTVIKGKNGIKVISTPLELCNLIKADWCKSTQSKSFTDWADELNADKNFSGGFTKEMALDNLASTYTLNINGKYVNLYQFFLQHKPFTNGNKLIKGIDLTEEQKQLLKFKGMANPEFVTNHSFWFKNGNPSTDEGYIYPVCHSLSHLPY